MKVYDNNILSDDIIVEISVSYFGDAELIFGLNNIDGGIKNIELEGTLRVVLKHLIPQPPLVCGIELSFLKCPTYDFELMTALAPLNMFASGDLIRSVIQDQLCNELVYPNKIYIKLKDLKVTPVMPKVKEVVRVRVQSVQDLTGFDRRQIQLAIKMGSQYIESSPVEVQGEKASVEFEGDLLWYDNTQDYFSIIATVREEGGEAVELKGSVGIFESKENINHPLTAFGSVSLDVSRFTLSTNLTELQQLETKFALLEVFFDSLRHSSKLKTDGIFAELSIGGQTKQTDVLSLDSSSWKKCFTFIISDPENDVLSVKLIDQLTSNSLAQYDYNIRDLMTRKKMEHKLQTFPLIHANQDCEILMQLKLGLLKTFSF